MGPQGSSEKLITYVTDRAGHDFRYAIDLQNSKRIELEAFLTTWRRSHWTGTCKTKAG